MMYFGTSESRANKRGCKQKGMSEGILGFLKVRTESRAGGEADHSMKRRRAFTAAGCRGH